MIKEKSQARRDQVARMRAEQKRKERRSALLMWGIGGVVILLLIGSVGFVVIKDQMAKNDAAAKAEAAVQTMLPKVKNYKYVGSQHTQIKVKYVENPPVGGEHNFTWQNCGVYTEPINNETAVHSLEHGAVWITYQPELPPAEIAKLTELAADPYMLLSPYPGLPSKIVASSWNHQIAIDSADSADLPAFIKKFKQGPDTPELGASCSGAVGQTAAEAVIPTETPAATPSDSSSPMPTMPTDPAVSASPSAQ